MSLSVTEKVSLIISAIFGETRYGLQEFYGQVAHECPEKPVTSLPAIYLTHIRWMQGRPNKQQQGKHLDETKKVVWPKKLDSRAFDQQYNKTRDIKHAVVFQSQHGKLS